MMTEGDEAVRLCRCLVVAHTDPAYTVALARGLRRRGWEVHIAATGPTVRRLVRELSPAVVVLGTELVDESGWLTCAKLIEEFPELRVILVDTDPVAQDHQFAAFAGASALVKQGNGTAGLLRELEACVQELPV
jgi:ActR/RegA family two-component response regulator